MKIEIRTRAVEAGAELRAFIERRLQFALDRFEGAVRRVTVRLRDDNGPRGGVDKACSVLIEAERGVLVLLEDRDSSVRAAASRAIERAAHALSRALARTRAPV